MSSAAKREIESIINENNQKFQEIRGFIVDLKGKSWKND